ncbi:MAG: hypothetical protein WCP20_11080 [Desulfuromonadales bacterium]
MINLATLSGHINSAGLMYKSFFDCTRSEIELICNAVLSSFDNDVVPPDGWEKPYLDDNCDLHITFKSHPKYHWWTTGGQSILETLVELDASWSVAKKYLDNKYMTEADYLNRLIPF